MANAEQSRMLTFKGGGWVIVVGVVLSVLYGVKVVSEMGHHKGDGVRPESYGFVLTPFLGNRAMLVGSNLSKDGLPALTEPGTITPAEVQRRNMEGHRKFLVSTDRVIGVTINGESRCYPTLFLDIHEIVNDVVGGKPVLVTWSPLAGCAVVFDRSVRGAVRRFGFSGLVYQSDQVLYDNQDKPAEESLWSQIAMKAIAGKEAAAGTVLTLVPFEYVAYGEWVKAHPATGVMKPNEQFVEDAKYNDIYSSYRASDEVKFPVDPVWDNPSVPKKALVFSVLADGGWKQYPDTAAIPKGADAVVPCYIFAWYAQRKNETLLVK